MRICETMFLNVQIGENSSEKAPRQILSCTLSSRRLLQSLESGYAICFYTPRQLMRTKPPKISKSEYETLANLRYALRQFLRFSEEAAQGAGLTPQQHQALLAIKGFGGTHSITIGELAERLQIRHHSAVGLVDRLVSQDLIARKQGTKDRRQVNLALTARGEAVLEQLSAVHREQLRRAGPKIAALLKQLG
jgi:DNA-binding MarR family transcriptional regulator